MKKMTQWAAVAAGLVLVLAASRTVALADDAAKGDRLQHRVERMKERLNLTDDQARQLEQVFRDAHQQWQSDRTDQTRPDKATMQARREKMNEQIKSILTPEQQQKWEQMRKEHRGRGRHWKGDKEKTPTTPSYQ
jgi:Spy/CpxP family protein refolding chaperone